MLSLPDRLCRIFAVNAERPFLIDSISGRIYTYTEALAAAAAAADALSAHGVRRGDRIGFELANSPEFALLYLACLLGGFTAVPLNNALAIKDRSFILEKSRLALLITDGGAQSSTCPVLSLLHGTRATPIGGTDVLSIPADGQAERGMALLARVDSEALFAINFTSGTTSLPKGVPHRVGVLLGNAASFNEQFALGRQSRFLHVMPMAYMAGFLNTLLCPLMAEAAVVLAPQFGAASALRFWEPVVNHQADTFWMSPTMLATLNRVDRSTTGTQYCRQQSIRIFSATAPLPMKIRRDFEDKYGTAVIESYGLSELLLITANLGPRGIKDHSVGVALPEIDMEIRSEAGKVVDAGGEGSIFVRTPFRSIGYLDYESGQPVPETEDWVDTGDVGTMDTDGYLFVTGRRKDLIIRGGFNISPRAVEEVLLQHPGIENVAVVGIPHPFYGEEVVAVIMARGDTSLSVLEADLRLACSEKLGPSSVPDRFVETAELPLSTTGKIQKNIVRDRIAANDQA